MIRKIVLFIVIGLFCADALVLPLSAAVSSQAKEYLRKARVFFERGNLKEALDFCRRAEKIEPESEEIKSAGAEIDSAIEREVKELRRQVEFYFNARNIPEAEKAVQKLLVLSPDDEFGKAQVAEIKRVNDQIEEFRDKGIVVDHSTGRAHDVDLYNSLSLLNRARGFLENGDREKALELVEKVLKREPSYRPALELKEKILHVNRIQQFIDSAEAAFQEGRMRECVDHLDKLITESAGRLEYVLLRARAHLRLRNFSEASRDLWYYLRQKPDERALIYPYLSDLYYESKRYDLALAFAIDPTTGEQYKNLSFQYRSFFKLYSIQFVILGSLILLLIICSYFSYRQFDKLVNRFPPGKFSLGTQLFRQMLTSGPETYLPILVEVARGLNIAWLNYYAGICLFRAGQFDGAQRFLAYSFNNRHLAGRAYYFFGLTKKLLNQETSGNDFDEAIVFLLGRPTAGWYPEFVKRIERELLSSYSIIRDDESYEGMAWQLVSAQVGEKI